MGLLFSKIFEALGSFGTDREARILMLGLDGAGKTTLLYKVKLNEQITTIPTIGFNVETVQPAKGISFTVWDVGGQDKIRPLWQHYFQNTEGLIFMVDSADRDRFAEAAEELMAICGDDRMRDVPVLILANKQDLPNSASPSQLIESLRLNKLNDRKWHVQASCANTGDGIYEGMNMMADMVREFRKHHFR